MVLIDDLYLLSTEEQQVAMKKWCSMKELALLYKGKEKMRDNNCKANHDKGLQKRIDNYNTAETVRCMKSNPVNVNAQIKHKFYGNVLKMLKLA